MIYFIIPLALVALIVSICIKGVDKKIKAVCIVLSSLILLLLVSRILVKTNLVKHIQPRLVVPVVVPIVLVVIIVLCVIVFYILVRSKNQDRFQEIIETSKNMNREENSVRNALEKDADNEIQLVKDYRQDSVLRHSFSRLAMDIFSIDFENWYKKGYWTEKYIPYSILLNRKIVANVSVNLITYEDAQGKQIPCIQLGTVMTDPEYRGRGLIRILMNEIEKDYPITPKFLFANSEVTEFYPKFGFKKGEEILYSASRSDFVLPYDKTEKGKKNRKKNKAGESVEVSQTQSLTDVPVSIPMETRSDWKKFMAILESSVSNSAFHMNNNNELLMFYLSSFMNKTLYFISSEKVCVCAEAEEGNLHIYDLFADHPVDLANVIRSFMKDSSFEFENVSLGFTPDKNFDSYHLFKRSLLQDEDTVLFVKGDVWNEFMNLGYRFPELSHA